MSISKIRALWLADPGTARRIIMNKMKDLDGNIKATANALGCDYQTLRRLIKKDKWLRDRTIKLKNILQEENGQRGWGPWHRKVNSGDIIRE